ncbi:hypothetical protein IE81DRAFT_325052 [Ceraceosorus guamensis]|uniref:Amino acid permease/ SLC12A domain-containing protein n=1 Tax=Ceraceosorus guamensis TaxID=1522189 RepID=A0A316VWZ0_9BASI|nr:hypothetical protein IE81DRAFT_325052 [Ceraceosorus guamensis]PWN40963.1 hypothetical protein IE81DRAFT_325052 [Ceraceosorus guamensis]
MSHFVSHNTSDFDALNQQLLQRQSNVEGHQDDGEDTDALTAEHASYASRRPASVHDASQDGEDADVDESLSITPTASTFGGTVGTPFGDRSQAEAGSTNSPDRLGLVSPRTPLVAQMDNGRSAPSASSMQSRSTSAYSSRKNSPEPDQVRLPTSPRSRPSAAGLAPPGTPTSTVRPSSVASTPARESKGKEGGKSRSKGRDRKLSDPDEPIRPAEQFSSHRHSTDSGASGDESEAGAHSSSGGKGLRSRLKRGSSAAAGSLKGVSFSDTRAGPGEQPAFGRSDSNSSSRTRAREAMRDASGLEELGRHMLGHHQHHHRSAGMISSSEMPPRKLGTWDGVFMPVSLNILGIILFLRFGFILGQAGLLGALLLLFVSYAVDALTAMSVSAISTNGQVRGGGAYYLISRSLGPEFGGSIGLVFFLGQALNAAMNVLGFVESLTDAFGESRGSGGFLPEGPWFNFFYGSLVLVLSTLVCLTGSALFARATLALAIVLGVSILSIPVSSFAVAPFSDPERGAYYTGWSLATLQGNLLPRFTTGAAGSSTGSEKESWQTVFGVLFPAVTGLLAGASMSGDLRKPSKSIPKGTNWSLVFTFIVYVLCFVVFASTIERESFYLDVGIVSDVALSPQIITFGALASTAFSALMGVMACAKVLQAIARDNLLPILDDFAQGTELSDTPTYAVFATYVLCQAVLFVDSVNTIAQLVTMTSLLTFGVLSFATLALKAGGAPSFRPSFRYWNIWTAGGGTIACIGAMYFTDPLAASACIVFSVFLFAAIHICCPPKPWGDVTRNLNYHIVRKYLLRLDERKGHVKYWRPQILLLVNNARTDWNLIIFCNSLKKGALYVLGHVLKGEFQECLGELRKQQVAWLKLVDVSGIKSFVDVIIARDEREGARNLVLSCGLGGMRPNVVVMGFPSDMRSSRNRKQSLTPSHRSDGSEITIKPGNHEPRNTGPHSVIEVRSLPTDIARRETPILPTTFVGIMEDTLALNKALAVAYGFESLSLSAPPSRASPASENPKDKQEPQYIDLWPIQIQSPDQDPSHAWDTYTMVLQLGTILSMTGTWKSHQLRVSVFVEQEADVENERRRVRSLLDNLRVPATLRVFHLASGNITSYQAIVWGKGATSPWIEMTLGGDPWWEALKQLRREDERRRKEATERRAKPSAQPVPGSATPNPNSEAARKQSKREQKIMGVSLPAEHLAYFKRNIRIGLAHPRVKERLGTESDAESTEWSDSDSDSDLSDELARLGFEDGWDAGDSSGLGLKRSKTYSSSPGRRGGGRSHTRRNSLGNPAGLPDEPRRRPLLHSREQSNESTYGSLSSTPRASALMNRPSANNVAFPSGPTSSMQRTTIAEQPESDQEGTLKASDRMRAQAQLLATLPPDQPSLSSSGAESSSETEEDDSRRPFHVRSRSEEGPNATSGRRKAKKHRQPGPVSATAVAAVPLVSFNGLPNKAQYLILNELIRVNSSPSTSVILTALPAPEPGTSSDTARSLRYLEQLESLYSGGPPMLGVHAKQLTMTSAL